MSVFPANSASRLLLETRSVSHPAIFTRSLTAPGLQQQGTEQTKRIHPHVLVPIPLPTK